MNSFNPESLPPASNDSQLDLPLTSGSFFGNLVPLDTKVLSGGEYIALYKKGMDAGFSDNDLKAYLKEKGIEIKSSQPPAEVSAAVDFNTPDNGIYKPRSRN